MSETHSQKRKPSLDFVLAVASALDMTAAQLVAGTDAANIFGDWVPRAGFDREVELRLAAQRDLAATRDRFLGADRVATTLYEQLTVSENLLSEVRRRVAALEVQVFAETGKNARREQEIERLRTRLSEAETRWADVQARLFTARAQAQDTRHREARGAVLAIFGTVLDGIVGTALSTTSNDDNDRVSNQ
jgi:hypothetical protein